MKSLDQVAIDTIRTLSMDAVQAADSGHPGTPMALAPLGWMLFSRVRKHDPHEPSWPDRDRFVLSCGHASMLQYSLLHLSGYPLPLDELKHFRQWDSKTPGHPEVDHTPGIETTTGPLGQGFANAVGMAMAEQHLAARFNKPGHAIVDHFTYVLASDGDLMEGVCCEAASIAGHVRLAKLIVFWDDNNITIDGRTELTFGEDVRKRFDAYGWHVQSVEDGNDVDALERATIAAQKDDRPSFIRVKTIIGWPAPTKQNTSGAHGSPLGKDEIAKTKEIMGVPQDAFHVPSEVHRATAAIVERGTKARGEWQARFDAYKKAHPDDAKAFEQALRRELPAGWDAELPKFAPNPKGEATRKSAGAVLTALMAKVPFLCGGSADLAVSNNTYQKGLKDFHQHEGVPRNMHFGIREHAMASICNGMSLHGGVLPFGATFLVFSDYMRPAIRLASIMKTPVVYVFTHDSIGLGEDGPTHQPIEHLAALRAIPGMCLIRPADANEARVAWQCAVQHKGPVALALTRQNVPTLDRTKLGSEDGVAKGGYVLAEASGSAPKVIVMASGSEVSIALAAREQLEAAGTPTRVVSMASWELFEAQPASYREQVLPKNVRARVVVEAGTRFGWERYAGTDGGFVTLERFGASAPAETLYEKLGITKEHVVAEAKRLLARE